MLQFESKNDFARKLAIYKPMNEYLRSIDTKDRREFKAYLASRLLANSNEEAEIRSVVSFLQLYAGKGAE